VVSMMFALHYSFETEELARGMLRNVSGALKKGGRFIGVMPDSDVISSKMKELLAKENMEVLSGAATAPENGGASGAYANEDEDDGEWDPEKPSEPGVGVSMVDEDDEWDPEKPSEPQANLRQGSESEEWNPEQPSEPAILTAAGDVQPAPGRKFSDPGISRSADLAMPPLSWGNAIYNVSFPRDQPLTKRPLPRDGIFRPPFGWKYNYTLEEAVNAPEFVVPWEAFRALAEDYGLELMYRKGFRDVFFDESEDRELGMLAERMKVIDRDRSKGRNGLLVNDAEMEAASFYHAFCFYKT